MRDFLPPFGAVFFCGSEVTAFHVSRKKQLGEALPESNILRSMQYMKTTLIYRKTETRADGVKLDMVIWQLPSETADRSHGIKYRLWAGRAGKTLVRYDNEAGKGDHKHVGAVEMPYVWRGLEWLVADFVAEVEALK